MTAKQLNMQKKSSVKSITSIFVDMDADKLLLTKIMAGDEKAFESLFRKYYHRLCLYAYQFVNNMPDAEELVQDTYVNFWEKRTSLNINNSFKSYIYSAVKNRGLNSIRGTQRRKSHHAKHHDNIIQISTIEDQLHLSEINDKLFEGLENLPPKCKKIFQMSRIEGLKHKAIANQLDIKVKTVENQIGIALKYLRKHLSEYLQILTFLFSTSNF